MRRRRWRNRSSVTGRRDEALFLAEEITKDCANVSTLIEEHGAEWIVKELFFCDTFNEYHPEYKCLCSKEYIEKLLVSLGKDELYDIIEKEGKITVDCQFCDKKYVFDKKDVDEFFV